MDSDADSHSTPHTTRDQGYADDTWNLNNMPVLRKSVLSHFGGSITGVWAAKRRGGGGVQRVHV